MKFIWFPDATAYPKNRLFCLDLLRGMDIFLLTLLGPFVKYGLFKSFPPSEWADLFWKHSITSFAGQGCAPTGWGIWDFGQPLFIFICGAAVPFAIPRRLDAQGRPTAVYWKHLVSRVAMLWGLGLLIAGVLTFDRTKFSPYNNTLQTIAVAYVGAALAMLIRRKWVRLALALTMIAAFGVVQATCGDYTRLGNISRIIDGWFYGSLGFPNKDFCYVLTTVVWAAMGILGSLAAEILKAPLGQWQRARLLAGWGAASYALGLVLGIWIPTIRYIYTVSFVFQSLGLAMLVLDALFVITDIWQLRRGWGYFLLMGQCSLTCWMLSTYFSCAIDAIAWKIIVGVPQFLSSQAMMPIISWIVYAGLFTWLVSARAQLRRVASS